MSAMAAPRPMWYLNRHVEGRARIVRIGHPRLVDGTPRAVDRRWTDRPDRWQVVYRRGLEGDLPERLTPARPEDPTIGGNRGDRRPLQRIRAGGHGDETHPRRSCDGRSEYREHPPVSVQADRAFARRHGACEPRQVSAGECPAAHRGPEATIDVDNRRHGVMPLREPLLGRGEHAAPRVAGKRRGSSGVRAPFHGGRDRRDRDVHGDRG